MKEHPILFSAEMVRAILEGRKTQTRRVLKQGYFLENNKNFQENYIFDKMFIDTNDKHQAIFKHKTDNFTEWFECPYGQTGDILWVRETWFEWGIGNPEKLPYLYRATTSDYDIEMTKQCGHTILWRPSIFMPRCASRVTLEIINIRVERVQDISLQDCKSEGLPTIIATPESDWSAIYRDAYRKLWDSINGKKYPWSSNPWVWVIEFKRIEK